MTKKPEIAISPNEGIKLSVKKDDAENFPLAHFILHICKNLHKNTSNENHNSQWIAENFTLLIDHCKQNRVFPFFYKYLEQTHIIEDLPAKAQEQLKNSDRQVTLRQLKLLQVYSSVIDAFNHNNIRHITLKGLALSQLLYEGKVIRPMIDIDLLLHTEDIENAVAVLKSMLQARSLEEGKRSLLPEYQHHVDPLVIEGIAVELHTHLFTERSGNKLNIAEAWNNSLSKECFNTQTRFLTPEYHLFYLACHAMQHFHRGNIRLLWFVDITEFIRKFHDEIDFAKCLNLANKSQQEDLFVEAICLVHDLFDIELPEEGYNTPIKTISKNYQRMLKQLEYGIKKTDGSFLIKDWMLSGQWGYKIKFLYKELFPPKQYIIAHYKITGKNSIIVTLYYLIRPFLLLGKVFRMTINRIFLSLKGINSPANLHCL